MRCPRCHRRLAASITCPRDGVVANAQPEPESSVPSLPGLTILSRLGAGGFAEVFAVRDSQGRERAAKVARSTEDLRLQREAEVLGHLGGQWAPELHGSGAAHDGRRFLLMEHLHGESLDARLARSPDPGALRAEEALALLRACAAPVDAMHLAGWIHRDLKPENLFLREDGRAVLIDFGLARRRDAAPGPEPEAALTQADARLGTPEYMAPEQCLDARMAGTGSDLYALAVIAFELLTGRPPFVGEPAILVQAHVNLRPPSPSSLAQVPAGFDAVFARALAKDPAARFGSAGELVDSLDAALSTQQVPSVSTAPPVRRESVQRTVALLGVESDAPVDALLAQVAAEGGALVRTAGPRLLLAFLDAPHLAAGLQSARRLAESLAASGTRCAVHVAELVTRGARVRGAALDDLERWWPSQGEALHLTPEAAARFEPEPHRASGARPEAPFVGRDGELAALIGAAVRARKVGRPVLATIVGAAGLGKSRMLGELEGALPREGFRVLRLTDGTPAALLRLALATGERLPTVEEIRAALAPLSPDADALWPAAALAIGALAPDAPAAAAFLGVPGALRHGATRALALLIRGQLGPAALLLDDLPLADPTTLDALELATMERAPNEPARPPLVIVATASPDYLEQRPRWGERAAHGLQVTLEPLEKEASGALLLALLRPVEFAPGELLERLLAETGGVPAQLVELVQALHAEGAIRRAPETQTWQLAAEIPAGSFRGSTTERLAQRLLAPLPAALQRFAFCCAVLGEAVSAAELEALSGPLEPVLGALAPEPALRRLVEAGLLVPLGAQRAFPTPRLRQAIERLAPAPLRASVHRAAFVHLGQLAEPGQSELLRQTRHAVGCGEREAAGRLHAQLGQLARQNHRYLEADDHFSAALELLAPGDALERARLLSGRGAVRYRVQRFAEALEDLQRAREISRAGGDRRWEAELLLEEATLLDWLEDSEASAACVAKARAVAAGLDDPALELRLLLGEGRTQFRAGDWKAASELLAQVSESARMRAEHEPRAIALVLLAFALTCDDRLDEAALRFDEVIALCRAAGDRLHLGIAHSNRFILWVKLHRIEPALDDLREALRLARELGYVQIERFATYNLAVFLHWLGRAEESLPLARRAHDLGVRFFPERPSPYDALLLARLAWARGDASELVEQLGWLEANCPPGTLAPNALTLLHLAELLRDEAQAPPAPSFERWDALAAEASQHGIGDDLLEVLHTAATVALGRGERARALGFLERALGAASELPYWRSRLDALRSRCVGL